MSELEFSQTESLAWRKASASGTNGCVEVAPLTNGGVAVRDSKDPSGPTLSFTRREWSLFREGMKSGEFDLI